MSFINLLRYRLSKTTPTIIFNGVKLLLSSVVFVQFSAAAVSAFSAQVKPGIEVLLNNQQYYQVLKGKRLGLITNQTGIDSNLKSTIDILYEDSNFNLKALFAPEHGLRGEFSAGEKFGPSLDEKTHLPIYPLYGNTKKPTAQMLKEIDVLIFDIQDIGVRTYTYISTLLLAMEKAEEYGKKFMVLDRPNPLGGLNVEGPVLKPQYKSFIGAIELPLIHGMTVGEIAGFIKGEKNMELELTVVPVEGWKREMIWEDTGLPWVPTSPHIPTVDTAFLYATTGTIGSANLSNGVGYTLPFQLVASEWIDPFKLVEVLNSKTIPGVKFQPYWFKPFYSNFKDRELKGVRLILTDKRSFMPVRVALEILTSLESLFPGIYQPPQGFNKIWGVDYILSQIKEGKNVEQIMKTWENGLEEFKKKREKYLLYR